MRWAEIRERYPNQWLIVDALEAHTEGDRRKLDQMTVVEICPDGAAALRRYQELHRQHPQREFYFVHTARQELDIRERYWLGLWGRYATHPDGLSATDRRDHQSAHTGARLTARVTGEALFLIKQLDRSQSLSPVHGALL